MYSHVQIIYTGKKLRNLIWYITNDANIVRKRYLNEWVPEIDRIYRIKIAS